MKIGRAHRFELKPNNAQRAVFARCAGTARFAWNWALAERQRLYREKEGKERFTNAIEQHRVLNGLKQTAFPWMYEVSKCVPQDAIRNLDDAYRHYRLAKKAGRKARLPRFKKKGKARDSFAFTTGAVRAEGAHVVLPRIGNIRRDALHKATTHLAKNHGEVVIEDLNVRGMTQNRRLARAVSDVGMAGFRKQLEYKCRWCGSRLTVAPRFYPSTRRCSSCGHVKDEMSLSERIYRCESCGLVLDRDLNAALNLVAVNSTETLNACGDLASTVPFGAPRAGSVKQEVNAAIPQGMGG